MSYISDTLSNLVNQTAFFNLTVGNYVMNCGGLHLPVSGNQKEYEPLLLVPNRFWYAFGKYLSGYYLICRGMLPADPQAYCISSICWTSGVSFHR